jgi:hypothetical protein
MRTMVETQIHRYYRSTPQAMLWHRWRRHSRTFLRLKLNVAFIAVDLKMSGSQAGNCGPAIKLSTTCTQ